MIKILEKIKNLLTSTFVCKRKKKENPKAEEKPKGQK